MADEEAVGVDVAVVEEEGVGVALAELLRVGSEEVPEAERDAVAETLEVLGDDELLEADFVAFDEKELALDADSAPVKVEEEDADAVAEVDDETDIEEEAEEVTERALVDDDLEDFVSVEVLAEVLVRLEVALDKEV